MQEKYRRRSFPEEGIASEKALGKIWIWLILRAVRRAICLEKCMRQGMIKFNSISGFKEIILFCVKWNFTKMVWNRRITYGDMIF
jgi:hypothetical protein